MSDTDMEDLTDFETVQPVLYDWCTKGRVETAARITIGTIIAIVSAVVVLLVISVGIICCCICKKRRAMAGTVYRAAVPVTSTTYQMPAPYYGAQGQNYPPQHHNYQPQTQNYPPQPTNYSQQGYMIPSGQAPPPYPGPPLQQTYPPVSGEGYPQCDYKAQPSCPPPETQSDVLQKASAPPLEPY